MNEPLKALIEKLSATFLAAVCVVVLIWYGILTIVALTTNRAVDFFPPHIGVDKTLRNEAQELSSQVARLEQNEQAHRDKLLEVVVNAREKSLSLTSTMTPGMTEAADNVTHSEEALQVEDEKYLKQIEVLQERVKQLSDRL